MGRESARRAAVGQRNDESAPIRGICHQPRNRWRSAYRVHASTEKPGFSFVGLARLFLFAPRSAARVIRKGKVAAGNELLGAILIRCNQALSKDPRLTPAPEKHALRHHHFIRIRERHASVLNSQQRTEMSIAFRCIVQNDRNASGIDLSQQRF